MTLEKTPEDFTFEKLVSQEWRTIELEARWNVMFKTFDRIERSLERLENRLENIERQILFRRP